MLASIIRTIVPLIVGMLVTLLAQVGLGDVVDVDNITELVTLVVSALYYAAVRWLEQRDARWGWLLGIATAPTYPTLAEAREGLTPVPARDVVALVDRHGGLADVAGPASMLPTGTRVAVIPER